MSIEHVVEVESIDDFRGKEFDILNLFHRDCNGGKIGLGDHPKATQIFCYGCRYVLAYPNPEERRAIIDLALNGDEDTEVTYEDENKNKIVHFVLASSK